MKLSYFLIGAVFVIGAIFFVRDEFINLEIQNKGQWVEAVIIEKPESCLGTKAKWFMKVKYRKKTIGKQISSGFCQEHNMGDVIKVKYLEGIDRILLPEENVATEFVAISVLLLFGLYVIYLGRKAAIKAR